MRFARVVVPIGVVASVLVLVGIFTVVGPAGPFAILKDVHVYGWKPIDTSVSDGSVTFQAHDMMTQNGGMFIVYSLNPSVGRADAQPVTVLPSAIARRLVDGLADSAPIEDQLVSSTDVGSIRIASLGFPEVGRAAYGIELTSYRSDDPARSLAVNLFRLEQPDDPRHLAGASTTFIPDGANSLVAVRHDASAQDIRWVEIIDVSGSVLGYYQLGPADRLIRMSAEEFGNATGLAAQ